MKARHIFILITTILLIAGVTTGVSQALNALPAPRTVAQLENVRAYAVAPDATGINYAVDGGVLFAGNPGEWTEIRTPADVVVGTVATDAQQPERLYMGAANGLAIYRTTNQGRDWQRIPLVEEDATMTGGVTSMAVDPVQNLVYAGTDTAGLFRLRDVGESMVLTAHLLTDAPVREVVVDQDGKGFLFARTDWTVFRGENYGLAWMTVDGINSVPTALAIGESAETAAPIVYVGTMDRGVVRSTDGHNWATANEGLNFTPGSRLTVDALSVDPAQPDTLYVATSYLYGSSEAHSTPSGVYMNMGDAVAWNSLGETLPATAAALLPVSGRPGAVYAVTTSSRTPLALGTAPDTALAVAAESSTVAQPAAANAVNWTAILAWIVAGLAAAALVFAIATDLRRSPTPVAGTSSRLRQQPVSSKQ
ncbi:MAG: hypothetical protein WDZ49_01695 [Litorilinea sp.]